MQEIEKMLKDIIIINSQKTIMYDDITEQSSLIADFGFDSIRIVSMLISIEDKLNISIDDDENIDVNELMNYGNLIRYVMKRK